MSLTDDALEQVERLFRENAELRVELSEQRTRANVAESAAAALRGQRDAAYAARDEARAQLKRAETERDEWIDSFDLMRAESDVRGARLAEIGETDVEWGVDHGPLGTMTYGEGKRYARHIAPKGALRQRLVGKWREVEEGGERG